MYRPYDFEVQTANTFIVKIVKLDDNSISLNFKFSLITVIELPKKKKLQNCELSDANI